MKEPGANEELLSLIIVSKREDQNAYTLGEIHYISDLRLQQHSKSINSYELNSTMRESEDIKLIINRLY